MSSNLQLMNILKNCAANNTLRKTNTNLYIAIGCTLIAVIYLTPKLISVMKESKEKEKNCRGNGKKVEKRGKGNKMLRGNGRKKSLFIWKVKLL